jgi:hypothetical protein
MKSKRGKPERCFGTYRKRRDENNGKEFFFSATWHNDIRPSDGERIVPGHFVPDAQGPQGTVPPEFFVKLMLSKHQQDIVALLAEGWWISGEGHAGIFHRDHPSKRCSVDTVICLRDMGILQKIQVQRESIRAGCPLYRSEFTLTQVGKQIAKVLIPF